MVGFTREIIRIEEKRSSLFGFGFVAQLDTSDWSYFFLLLTRVLPTYSHCFLYKSACDYHFNWGLLIHFD